MKHFVGDDHLNAFRLPVGWQYLLNNNLGGTLDPTNSGKYDQLVQACTNSGASMCIIDVSTFVVSTEVDTCTDDVVRSITVRFGS